MKSYKTVTPSIASLSAFTGETTKLKKLSGLLGTLMGSTESKVSFKVESVTLSFVSKWLQTGPASVLETTGRESSTSEERTFKN